MQKNSLQTSKNFEKRILAQFNRVGKHLLIGEISLETGYSLKIVEAKLNDLVLRGAVRKLSDDEKSKICLHALTEAYVLIDTEKFEIA